MALSCYRMHISREVAIIINKKNTIVLYVIHLIMVIHPFGVSLSNIFRDQKKVFIKKVKKS